jgi:hypothetical protein
MPPTGRNGRRRGLVKIRDYRVWTKTAKNEKIIYIKKISK